MPANDREVFDYFSADPATAIEIDFIAYAIFTFEKHQWLEQSLAATGRLPANDAIDRWVADITASRFDTMREQAAQLFDAAARTYLADEMEEQTQAAVRSSILDAVKAASGFWKQMAIALVTAILAPLIIGGMIAAALTYDRLAPTATAMSHRLLQDDAKPVQDGAPLQSK